MSWEGLLAIYREAADEARAELSSPPQACPRDGEPLRSAGSVLYCPFGCGYQWPRDGRY